MRWALFVLFGAMAGCGADEAERAAHEDVEVDSRASDVSPDLSSLAETDLGDIGPSADAERTGQDAAIALSDGQGDVPLEGDSGGPGDDASSEEASEGDAPDAAPALYPDLPEALQESITLNMESAKVPGLSACILKDHAIFWCGGFGQANLEQGVAATEQTPFLLASISKLFAATVVLQLVESGAIELEADVSELLGWSLAHPTSSVAITMKQLLTHRGGIKDNWGAMADFYAYGADPTLSLEEAVEGYFQPGGTWYDAEANFTPEGPGEAFRYANMAVALAAHIVEVVSGQDFNARSRETLLDPLGLEASAWRLSDFEDLGALAMPYVFTQEAYQPTGHYTFSDYPNGGLRASALDLARFVVAYQRGGELDGVRILEPESVSAALSAQDERPSGAQGWMWYQASFWGATWWGHSGAEKGVWTEAFFRESDQLGFITLANGDGEDPAPLYAIQEALLAWAEATGGE